MDCIDGFIYTHEGFYMFYKGIVFENWNTFATNLCLI